MAQPNPNFDVDDLEEVGDNPPNAVQEFITTSSDILTKPFTMSFGKTKKEGFNPFRKKSGLLNVLARQSVKQRICFKNGQFNTFTTSEETKTEKFVADIYISMIHIPWTWIFLLFAAAFLLSWLAFSVIWYLTALVHGDFDPEIRSDPNFRPCVDAIEDFTSCFLFSLETQHTIGYGGRATTEQCPFAIIVMAVQSIVGVIISTVMAGVTFAKFTAPIKRSNTIIFSDNAVITMRNGWLYLILRVCDLRKYPMIGSAVRIAMISEEVTKEGETIPYHIRDLKVSTDTYGEENDKLLFLWPVTIAHRIDQDSPLYELGPKELLNAQFELIVTVEGTSDELADSFQARTSYLPNEILWGHQFDHEVLIHDKSKGSFQFHASAINKHVTDETPRLSAAQLGMRAKRSSSSKLSINSVTARRVYKRMQTCPELI